MIEISRAATISFMLKERLFSFEVARPPRKI
jgi:hypothetical protein